MLNIAYLLPIIAFWHTITTEIRKHKQDHGVVNNMVSAIHCMLYILQYNYSGTMNYTLHVSAGFYLYDLLYFLASIYEDTTLLPRKGLIHQHTAYVIHHIISVKLSYDVLYHENNAILLQLYNIVEVSNIMIYVTYYLYKEYPGHRHLISFSEFIQYLWYSYFRVISGPIFIYHNQDYFLGCSFSIQISITSLYIMSVVWSCILLKKNIVNYLSLHDKTIE
jgi:hypothetical protein